MIEPLLPGSKRLGRKIDYSRREILNAIFISTGTGARGEMYPVTRPPYGIVSHSSHAWCRQGRGPVLNKVLRTQLRVAQGRHPQPSATILESQRVKTIEIVGSRGYDAGKKVKGRKQHILVDTMDFLLIVVHAASIQD